MNISLDLDGPRAGVRAAGYLSPKAGRNLAVLLRDLGRMEFSEIRVDISACSPVCAAALESLLDSKFCLAAENVRVVLAKPPPTVSKVFGIMGLEPDGERPGSPISPHRV